MEVGKAGNGTDASGRMVQTVYHFFRILGKPLFWMIAIDFFTDSAQNDGILNELSCHDRILRTGNKEKGGGEPGSTGQVKGKLHAVVGQRATLKADY